MTDLEELNVIRLNIHGCLDAWNVHLNYLKREFFLSDAVSLRNEIASIYFKAREAYELAGRVIKEGQKGKEND